MEQSLVHWEMMEFLPMKTLVISNVTLAMSWLVVTLGPVKVMGAGVVHRLTVVEVNSDYTKHAVIMHRNMSIMLE